MIVGDVMKQRHKEVKGSKKLFEIEVPKDAVKKRYDEIRDDIKKIAEIPGYRAGKAPRDIVEKFHGEKIKEETLQDLIAHSYRQALDESKTDTVGVPEVTDVIFDLEKGLSFKVKVDVRPTFNLKKYKGIPVKKEKPDVKEEGVEKYLSVLRESKATFTDASTRPAKTGDFAVCDLECFVGEKAIYPKRNGVWIMLDKSNPVPGMVEGLTGKSTGENVEVKTTLPKDFQDKEYSNKEAIFKINILNIKERQLPELNDEFVKSLGAYKNIDELKKVIRDDLKRKLEHRIRQDMEHQILSHLLKDMNFTAPQNLVDRETKRLVEVRKKEHQQHGHQDKPDEKILEEQALKDATGRVKLYFILDEIAKKESIGVDDKELDQVLASLATEYRKTKEEITKYYSDHKLLEGLKDQIKENKVIDFLLNNANVKN